jgi:hypothetical protein
LDYSLPSPPLPQHLPLVSNSEEDEGTDTPEPADGFRRPTPIRHGDNLSSTTKPKITSVQADPAS